MKMKYLLVKTVNNELWIGKGYSYQSEHRIHSETITSISGFIEIDDARQILAAEVGGGTSGISGIAAYGLGSRSVVTSPVNSVLLKVAVMIECSDAVYKEIFALPTCTAMEHKNIATQAKDDHAV